MGQPPITSTASGSLTRTVRRREAEVICCVGSSIVTGVPPSQSGRPGRRRLLLTVRHHASKARPGVFPMLAMPACRFQTAGLNLLLDPVWSERASPFRFVGPKRVNDPGIAFADLPPIDVVLVSHGHYDHLDLTTLSRIAAAHPARVITPLGNDTIMRNHNPAIAAEAYDWDSRVDIGMGVAVTLVAARHWSARNLADRNMSLWASFVIKAPGGRIYFVADSGYGDGQYFRGARKRHGPFRLAILPIGAYQPRWFMRDHHMNPAELVQAFIDCGAEIALAHHYGTFQLTDEPIDAPLIALADALKAAGISPDRFRATWASVAM